MILVYLFMSTLLCLPLLHSATRNNSIPIPVCPESFKCPGLAPFKYPFFNASDKGCGLIKIHCTSKVKEIQLGNRSYEIFTRLNTGSSLWIHNKTFAKLVADEKCEALMYNFTSPAPLLFSISIEFHPNLYKCKNNGNATATAEVDAYFEQRKYGSYNKCKTHNFYFKYSISYTEVPSDIPHSCEVIQLPQKLREDRPDEANIFSILSPNFSIAFPLTPSCTACNNTGGRCRFHNAEFQCLRPEKAEKHDGKLMLILVIAGSAFILILSFAIFVIWRCCKSNPFSYVSSEDKSRQLEDGSFFSGVSVFSYAELQDATQNFDPLQELGDGGFGAVYHGNLQDGREVAVKRLYEHNYKRVQQFINEVKLLTKLRHPNLVVLYGCTSRQSRELLLVYEYVPNGTVADHLRGDRANPSLLTWPIRMNIARETASALAYLHASGIIHRDVKTHNILLDHNFTVKVADFGLSRLLPNDVTYVSTAPQGTPGYVDPQYHQRYQLTDKSDVYSFGVVLVELISSMAAVDLSRSGDDISLANLALNRIQRCEINQLIDPALGSNLNVEITRMITCVAELAFLCLQFDSEIRPTMKEVLDMLEDIILADGRIDACDTINASKTIAPPPSFDTIDTVVLLKDQSPSPVSVTGEWHSCSSGSTAVSMSGDRLAMKNLVST